MVESMKRIILIVATLIVAYSCGKKEHDFPDAVPQDRTPVSSIEVGMPGDFKFPSGSIVQGWKIINGGKSYNFTASSEGNPVRFALPDTVKGISQIAYLLYPDVIVDSLWRGEFYLSLPQTQKAIENGFDSKLWISAAHFSGDGTTLTPVVGTFKFKIKQTDIYACEISSKDNGIAGALRIAMNKDIKVSKVDNSSGTVKVYGGLDAGKIYNAVVMADDYYSLDIKLISVDGTVVWKTEKDVSTILEKGGCIDLGEFGNPDISSIALSMTSSEFAGYILKAATAYSEEGTRLFGVNSNATITSGQTLTVKISGVEPADYSQEKLWFELVLEDASGNGVILPLKEDGFVIGSGTEVSCNLGELSSSRNAAPWFYPVRDKRLMAGDGYAYGEANTFLIQCKNSCYTGTVIDNTDIPGSVTIDYRLRGGLFSGPAPEGVSFEWLMGYNNSTPAWGKYTMDRTYIYNCDKYSFVVDTNNYTVTVTNNGAHAGSPILLMKKDGKVIWAWTFWNIAADGTKLEAVDFSGVKIANMDIGHCSNQISSITPKIQYIRQSCNYYQWGRPMPIFSAQGAGICLGENDERNASKPRIPVYDSGATTIEDAIAHPGTFIQNPYTKGVESKELVDWLSDGVSSKTDLWGGSTKDAVGIKSNYDPCPKGWRVPDVKTYLNAFPNPVSGYNPTDYPAETTAGYQGVYVNGVLFVTNGVLTSKTDNSGYVTQLAFTPNAASTAKDASRFWTNTWYDASNSSRCYVFKADYLYKKLNGTDNPDRTIGVDYSNASMALPVRCQKDEDNR